MKIRSVTHNNRRKAFEIRTPAKVWQFPYARVEPRPEVADPVVAAFADKELGNEGFTYVLRSGAQGTVHLDQVLEYNQDARYMRDALLYKLTLEAQQRVMSSSLSKREIIRRLGTSATQFYRLLDQRNYRKSIDQLLSLLQVLDYEVDLIVRPKHASRKRAA